MIIEIFNEIKKNEFVIHNSPVGYLFGRTVSLVSMTLPTMLGIIAVAAVVFYLYDRFKPKNTSKVEILKTSLSSPNKKIGPLQKKSQVPNQSSDSQNKIISEKNSKQVATGKIISNENSFQSINTNTSAKILEIKKEFPKIDLTENNENNVILKETIIETTEAIGHSAMTSSDLGYSSLPTSDILTKFVDNDIQNLNKEIPSSTDLPPEFIDSIAQPSNHEILPPSDLPPKLNVSDLPILSDDLPPPSDLPPKLKVGDLPILSHDLPPPSDLPPKLNVSNLPILSDDLPPPSDLPPELTDVEKQDLIDNQLQNDNFKIESQNKENSNSLPRRGSSFLKKGFPSLKKKIEINQPEPFEIKNEIDPEMDPKEKRKKTLIEAKKAYHNCKKIYDFYSDENKTTLWSSISHISHEAKVIFKKLTSSEDAVEKDSSTTIAETLSQLKDGVDSLESLKKRLKNDEILSFSEEISNESRLNGLIKTIELKIESLKNLDSVSTSSIDKIEEVNLLIDELKPEKNAAPEKIIESKVDSWTEEALQRNNFFNELITAEQNLAIDLKYFLSCQEGIQTKFQDSIDFCLKYETICENSKKMALELAKLNNENSDAKKMALLVTILQSSEFKDYIGSIKDYLPLAANDSILKSGIDSRALTLPTTRLALYPLLIAQAIKLTPSGSQEFADLTLELKNLKEELIFLNS